MGFWNHRVVKKVEGDDVSFQLHEAYYNEEDRNNPNAVPYAITENAITLSEESIENLQGTLDRIAIAMKKPVLDYETMTEALDLAVPDKIAPEVVQTLSKHGKIKDLSDTISFADDDKD